jgi:hypothetical protein
MKVKAKTNGKEHTSIAENKMPGVFGRQQFNHSTRLAWLEPLGPYAFEGPQTHTQQAGPKQQCQLDPGSGWRVSTTKVLFAPSSVHLGNSASFGLKGSSPGRDVVGRGDHFHNMYLHDSRRNEFPHINHGFPLFLHLYRKSLTACDAENVGHFSQKNIPSLLYTKKGSPLAMTRAEPWWINDCERT